MKPGDLAVTRDMGTASGKIAFIVRVEHNASEPDAEYYFDYTLYDAIIDSELIEQIDSSFLAPVGEDYVTRAN